MKYYAVTDDPNELMHFGIKGMKWGVRRTDAQLGHPRHTGSGRRRSSKPRSAAYKKASAKLSASMKNGINKAKANWREYNSPEAKEARFMKKAMQQAREGRLKYGKLNDYQVMQVTDRLALERSARSLGNTEKASFLRRLRESSKEGLIEGVGRGTAAYFEERGRGRGRTTAKIKEMDRLAKYESKDRNLRRQARTEFKKEYYKEQAESGDLHSRPATAAKILANKLHGDYSVQIARARGDTEAASRLEAQFKQDRANMINNFTQAGRVRTMNARRLENEREERMKKAKEDRNKAYYTNLGKHQADKLYGIVKNYNDNDSNSAKGDVLTTLSNTNIKTASKNINSNPYYINARPHHYTRKRTGRR